MQEGRQGRLVKLCKHDKYKVIDHILEPKYSTDEILINVASVLEDVEHYIIKFKKCAKYPDWFYMSGKMIRRFHTQPNGAGKVYVVPMSRREEFEPNKECNHERGI